MSAHDLTLDPAQLDPDALSPAAYHAVVGPALQVSAELAAARGDRKLCGDMVAMLALADLITGLARRWRAADGDDIEAEKLDSAPAAACVMVMQEAGMPENTIGQCLAALEAAHAQITAHEVTAPATAAVDGAWAHFQAGARELGLTELRQAAECVVREIETWQARVH
ncbi:MAG: hypothetical protein L0H19_03050 [Salinisphaera sp.]|nr:hypothetical protein [Salinisphaera sp.]MDN5937259.1 hypothetical protein [Salinisphaera sp.]